MRAEFRAILDVLIRADHAWQSPETLARRLGRDVERLTDALAEMDQAGWLAVWERPDGVRVTLSAWAAGRLGVRLVEAGGAGRWRWLLGPAAAAGRGSPRPSGTRRPARAIPPGGGATALAGRERSIR